MKNVTETLRTFLKDSGISRKGALLWILAAVILLGASLGFMSLSEGVEGFPVYMTEIVASNTSYPNPDGRCVDLIELHNSADYPMDLTGYQLGDIAGSARYAFPSGTVIGGGEYLVIYCDKTVEGYAPFGISRSGGESFYLIASNNAIVDSVVTVPTDLDEAMIRLEDGSWDVSLSVTPGRANEAVDTESMDIYNSGVSPVRISEFSSAGNGFAAAYGTLCDWVELHNTASIPVDISGFTLSDNVGNDKYVFPAGTVMEGNDYLVVYCTDSAVGAELAPFGLSQAEREHVVLKNNEGRIVEIVESTPLEEGSQALLPEGWIVSQKPTPGYENTDAGFEAFLETVGAAPGTVVISEVMTNQSALLPDGNGEFSDWVELTNLGDEAVNLAGWTLSDDPGVPDKWTFPDVTIQPGEHLLVFCSGRDGVLNGCIHADFSLSADGESVTLRSWLGNTVDAVNFGAADTNISFTFEAGEADACDLPTPGYENTEAGYEQFRASHVSAGPLAIWEVMTANDWYLPQALGECYDWVEIRNISDKAVNLSDYALTDDPDSPARFPLPNVTLNPGRSYCLFLSGDESLGYDHGPFALNAYEDQLFLYTAMGDLLDYVYLKDIPVGYSYGRSEEMGGFAYMEPSPENPNTAGYRLISAMPTSQYEPGVYSGDEAFTLTLEAEGTIYYTTNGAEPDASSALYTEPLTVDETTVIRAAAVEDGKLISDIYTATFVVGDHHDLPVVSLVTDPDYLWGYNGVYHNGDESVKEVKFPGNVAYCGADGRFSMDNEMSLHGATTVTAFDKKSFTVRFRDNYDGPLQYDVFEDGEVTTFASLLIRTAHESTYSTQMHDVLMNTVAAECTDSLLTQKYKYVALYLNGEYWGLYAFREHHSAAHYGSYMDVPASSVQMVRFATDGQNSLHDFYDFCASYSLSHPDNYAYATTLLDVESFADWIIFQAYACNIDINGNMRYYYSTADGKWRCGLVDMDLGMTDGFATFSEVADTWHHGQIVSALLESPEFQDLLATRLAEYLAGPLSDENMIAAIDEIAVIIESEAYWEEARWGTPVFGWAGFVEDMRDFCDGRAMEMIEGLRYQLGWSYEKTEQYFGQLMGD